MEVSEEMETMNTKITGMMAMAASTTNIATNSALVAGRTRFIFWESGTKSCALRFAVSVTIFASSSLR